MMDVGAILNALISSAGGFATAVIAILTLILIAPPCIRALTARAFLWSGLHGEGALAHRIPVNQP
jgi:hypothetical protein